ncbi:hypothetical protein IEQ34_003317 [Dendrobium chrysotoxum]|uniref:PRONE domain-containing protein n=1 Tax=Dendrobium chrysotoxum TaxID=161865 RepID=A0AAV7H3F4_DENCH|nr:hypothetical protein IEQ34_003317 [Dendrobium chrysotoxum]
MFEILEREVGSMIIENEKKAKMRQRIEGSLIGSGFDRSENQIPISRFGKESACTRCGTGLNGQHSDIEQMKEKLAKLLLGEDMSGCGKGVSSALALSNTITNLAGIISYLYFLAMIKKVTTSTSVFGEQQKLEPMSAETKCRWRREINWFLSVTDHIVEFVPIQQVGKDGSKIEIMTAKQRKDLLLNIPALRKLDAMLLGYLDNFKDRNEFWYIESDTVELGNGNAQRKDDKWWLPTVKVPSNGLSDVSRKWLEFQKESVNQVLKAAMAINALVLMEMEIPEAYIESLPKNGRASLGDSLYRNITVEHFDPESFLSSLDLSTEHKVLDLKNRIEASVVIWKRKMHNKDGKSWSSGVSLEKREQFEERAETILHLLKHRFPGIPQSALDTSKIQYNKDVGQSVLESYSRILETLAFTVMSMIEDVLLADQLAQDPSKNSDRKRSLSDSDWVPLKKLDPKEEMKKVELMESPTAITLSDFMGWALDQELENEKQQPAGSPEDILGLDELKLKKPPNVVTHKKFSYIEKLENLGGLRSPAARR